MTSNKKKFIFGKNAFFFSKMCTVALKHLSKINGATYRVGNSLIGKRKDYRLSLMQSEFLTCLKNGGCENQNVYFKN